MIYWSDIEIRLTEKLKLPDSLCEHCLIPLSKNNPPKEHGCSSCLSAKSAIKVSNSLIGSPLPIQKAREKYDCIVGLSGGVDSTYLLHELVTRGYNPFAVHIDNGWNTPTASNNIHKIISSLGVHFDTIVLDWSQFRKMQLALMSADVPDFENATDHIIFACLYRLSNRLGNIPIVQGINVSNENAMPPGLIHNKHDKLHLQAVYFRKYKSFPSKLPLFSNIQVGLYNLRHKGLWISALNYMNYDKSVAEDILVKKYDYQAPKRKHEESLITKIYQRVILPIKFDADKRLGHLSSLVNSRQMSRSDALLAAQTPFYETKLELRNDINKFLTYLELENKTFLEYLNRELVPHTKYLSDQTYVKKLFKIRDFFRVP